MDLTRLWVKTTGNTRVQINQTVTDNNSRCTISVNGNQYSTSNQSEKDIYVQVFTQQKEIYTKMADTWDTQGRDTGQLRKDLDVMQQKIDQLNRETDINRMQNEIKDLREYVRQTIQLDIRSIMFQRT